MSKFSKECETLQAYFDAPESLNAAAIRMNGMGKGLIWVNGEGVGRYWQSFLSPLGQPTQIEYHIPRSFLKPKKNLLVIFEEEPNVKPELMDFVIVNRDTVCSYVGENYTPSVRHWTRKQDQVQAITDNVSLTATLKCSGTKKIAAVEFASFGNPIGVCGNFTLGTCNAPVSKQVIEKVKYHILSLFFSYEVYLVIEVTNKKNCCSTVWGKQSV